MKVIVTGGAGFIGSSVIRNIIKNSNDIVINVDSLTYAGNLSSLGDCIDNERHIFELVDICDSKKIHEVILRHKPDAIMHLAAESHVDKSINSPEKFIKTNITGTYNLIEATRDYWSKLPKSLKENFRFHHVSTDEVYGDLGNKSEMFTENSRYDPSSPYSASKASSDHIVKAWGRTYGLPIIISNCSNNYGPYQFPEKLIPLIITNAIRGLALPIYGDGKQVRDWLYVEDHAKALLKILKTGITGETYNIGGFNQHTNYEVVMEICNILNDLVPNTSNKYEDLIKFVKDRPGHDFKYAIDSTKLSCDLGWKPNETFKSGLRKTVQWYLENTTWVERIIDGSYKNIYMDLNKS